MTAFARNTDPETSKIAARSVDTTRLQGLVVTALELAGANGLTASEASQLTGTDLNTISPRFRPLVNKGVIADSGRRRTTPTGKSAIVWVTTEYAIKE